MLNWTTAQVAPGDRFAAWGDALNATHLPWALRASPVAGFAAEVQSLDAGVVSIVNCRCAPCAGYRDMPAIRRSDDSHYGVLVLRHGRERVRQGDLAADLGPGSTLIWDTAKPTEFEVLEPLDKCTLFISKDTLQHHTGRATLPVGVLNSRQGFGALLRARIEALEDVLADFDGPGREALGLTLAHDLVNAARGSGTSGMIAPRQATLRRIGRIVEARFCDPDFGPAELAECAGLSLRYLHDLFRDERETVAARILRLRLEAVAADLATPALARLSVSQIGFARGFSSSAHLSRSFRARFDQSPSGYRRRVLGELTAKGQF